MSVRKEDRTGQHLTVINSSRILIDYTYDRVKDNKIFPKAQRWLLPNKIWDNAIGIRSSILHANSIRVESRSEAEARLLLIKEAFGYVENLEALIDFCNIKGLISDERADYWEGLVDDTVKELNGWLKEERERYRSYLE